MDKFLDRWTDEKIVAIASLVAGKNKGGIDVFDEASGLVEMKLGGSFYSEDKEFLKDIKKTNVRRKEPWSPVWIWVKQTGLCKQIALNSCY